MATRTRAELDLQALRVLGVARAGEAADELDLTDIDGYVDGVVEALSIRGVAYIGDANSIDPALFLPLAVCVAAAAAPEFGADLTQQLAIAEFQLRQLSGARPTYETMQAEYF